MTFYQFGTVTKLLVLSALFGLLFTSCGDDEDQAMECEGLNIISGDMTLNGSSASLSIAQLLVSNAFGETNYQFQVAGTSDCEELQTVSFVITLEEGVDVDGTYEFADFFYADDGEATGTVFVQNLSTLTQSSSDIESGSVTVTENSESNFTLDINAVPVQGSTVTMEVTAQF